MIKFSNTFDIAGRAVGESCPAYIIAEAGVAHFGSVKKAFALVDLAASAGADAVKFQIFDTAALISGQSAEWIERLRSKQLPYERFVEIRDYCREKGIDFFATAHDEPSLDFLDTLEVPVYKIGSGEVSNWPFLAKIATRKRPVIVSTGMYRMADIESALAVFEKAGNPDVAVLHCVTRYPTPPESVNLRAMAAIEKRFSVITGYSDHTQGFHFPLAAAALGAKVIEKHITLDFNVPNAQDWKVSCGPANLKTMVDQIRDIEKGLGDGEKRPDETEAQSLSWARKSLVATRHINKGEILSPELLTAKRPGTGISPAKIALVTGRTAACDIAADSLISWEQIQ